MKNFKFKWLLLSFLLSVAGISQVWATKRVYIDVSWNTNYNKVYVHFWGGSRDTHVSASLFASGTWNYMYYADIDDDATMWQVHRDDNGYCNYQNNVTYADYNMYKVNGWDNNGEARQIPGLVTGGYIYLDNTNSNWNNTDFPNRFMAIGNNTTKSYQISRLSGTNLWAGTILNTWPDASYFSFYGLTSGSWGDGSWGYSNISTNAPKYLAEFTGTYDLSSGGTYLVTPSGSSNGASFSFAYKEGGYSDLNKNQTLHVMLSTDGGSTYSEVTTTAASWKGTIKATYTAITGNGTATTYSGETAQTLNSSAYTKGAAITSDYRLDESSTATGYTFVGFNNSNSAPSSSNTTITINNITGTNDIYAFFKANSYTIAYDGNDESTGSTTSSTHYYGVAKTLTSNGFSKDNYVFVGWNTLRDGSGTPYSNGQSVSNLSATQGATVKLYAQWKQVLTLGSNGGSTDGSVTVYKERSDVSNFIEAVKTGYTCTGYFTAGGYQVIAAETGELVYSSDVSSYISSAGKWVNTSAAPSLVAHWTPTTYTITLNDGSGTGGDGTIAATYDAKTPVLANEPKYTGYNFAGYFTETSGGGVQVYNADLTPIKNVSGYTDNSSDKLWKHAGDVTLYAYWTEATHAITVNVDHDYAGTFSHGGESNLTTKEISGVGIVTATTDIVASAKNGFIFDSWTTEDEGVTINDDDNATTTINATTDGTVIANFKEDWYLKGNLPTINNQIVKAGAFTYVETNKFRLKISLPASQNYSFCLYKINAVDHDVNNSTTINNISNSVSDVLMYYNDNTQMSMNTRSGVGTYTFDWDITNTGNGQSKLSITYPSSSTHTVNFNSYSTTKSQLGTGTTTLSAKVGAVSLSSGNAVCAGEDVVFTQTPTAGYTFIGWYSNTDGAEGHLLSTDDSYTISSINANKTVYALYRANTYSVTIVDAAGRQVLADAVGPEVATSVDYTAADKAEYKFSSWTVSGLPSYSTGSSSTAHVVFTATEPITLTANYEELPKVYFQKPVSWGSDIWVYFYKGDYWDGTYGTGTNTGGNYTGNHYKMTQIGNTNIYYYAYNTTTPTNVAFADVDKETGTGSFSDCHIAYRGDFQTAVPMFVAKSISTGTKNTSAVYYNDGYWRNYNSTDSKFDMRGYDGTVFNSWAEDMFPFVFDSETANTAKVTINLTGGSNFQIKLYSKASSHNKFIYNTANYTVLPNNCTNLPMSDYNDGNFYIATTATGDYTFILTFTQDAINLSVEYPVTVGDLYVVNNTNSLESNVLKATSGSDVNGEIAIRLDAGENTLNIKECTGVTNPAYSVNNTRTTAGTLSTQGNVTWTTKSGTGTSPNLAKAGVYTMTLSRTGSTYALTTPTIYTDGYYIRTKCAPGRWSSYLKNSMSQNTTNYSEANANTFDYYFCKWISSSEIANTSVRFQVVTKYGNAVAETMVDDATLGTGVEYLPHQANVRFSYNSYTNALNRAYLLGSSDDATKYLVITSISSAQDARNVLYDETGNEITIDIHKPFEDKQNWIYELSVRVYPTAHGKIQAYYDGAYRDLLADKILMGGVVRGSYRYDIRLVYDFKINKLMSAYIPKDPLKETLDIYADMMIVREHQEDASTITFENESAKLQEIENVYGVMRFNRWTLNNRKRTGEHDLISEGASGWQSRYARDLYWISFPFNVNLKDVFGFGTYGVHWIIEYYDGVGRATNGFWADSEPNWKFVMPKDRDSYVLEANVGYILALDLDQMQSDNTTFWANNIEQVELYFPSSDVINSIENTEVTVEFPNQEDYQCHIDRRTDKDTPDTNKDRRIVDSYWHCIGVPSFGDAGQSFTESEDPAELEKLKTGTYWTPTGKLYLYEWNMGENTLSVVQSGSPYTFKTMYSYLVQFSEEGMEWMNVSNVPASVAARKTKTIDYNFSLSILRDSIEEDHTYVRLTDDEGITNAFEFNYDLCKEQNGGKANIWTVTTDVIPVAGNSMPKPVQTTLVPVGVKVVANGEYTFSMPEGTNGEDVFLIDNAYGTRTNLGLIPYTVTLTAGTYDSRFALEFGPIQETATGVENDGLSRSDELNDANDDVRKVFVGGRLYIIRDGKVYDAAGQRIE